MIKFDRVPRGKHRLYTDRREYVLPAHMALWDKNSLRLFERIVRKAEKRREAR